MIFNSKIFKDLNNKTENFAVRSTLNNFNSEIEHSALSIKLPINGIENYKINHTDYKLSSKNFLIVNKGEQIECNVNSTKLVDSVCIYLDKALYNSIQNTIYEINTLEEKADENYYDFHSGMHYLHNDDLSLTLKALKQVNNLDLLNEEFYVFFIESLISHQTLYKKALFSINAVNFKTKVELFRRLQKAKAYIYDSYAQNISLDTISKASNLSKYHLLRSYKQLFNVTPHQDLTQRRIEKSKEFLMQNRSIEEVTFLCGFNNRRSFSRTFKKLTGFSPKKGVLLY